MGTSGSTPKISGNGFRVFATNATMAKSILASATLGATCNDRGVRYRVWAPERKSARVLYPQRNRTFELVRDSEGYFNGEDPAVRAGELYD